jgi:hypothetical protein
MQQQRGPSGGNRGGARAPFVRGGRRDQRTPRVPGLTVQQVQERMDRSLCFVCGEAGHRKYDCPQNKEKASF